MPNEQRPDLPPPIKILGNVRRGSTMSTLRWLYFPRSRADHTLDLAIARNIRLGSVRQVQLRIDMFNALNTVIYNSFVTQLQLNSPTDQTVRNSQYNADGTLNPARLRPRSAGFGAVNGAQAMRTIQLQLRFQF